MGGESFLISQIIDKQKSSYLFPAIRREYLKQIEQRKISHKWNGNIHPSSLSFSMCPWKYFQEINEYRGPKEVLDVFRTDAGVWKHKHLQYLLTIIPNLLYDSPNIHKDLKNKLKEKWPEIPIWDEEFKLSGYCDAVIRKQNNPVPIEIKSTFSESDQWTKRFKDYEPHKTQVCIYAWKMNKDKYYDKEIKELGLIYYNISQPIGSQDAEYEYYFEFNNELKEKTTLLLEHLHKERLNYINSIESSCTYPSCREHSKWQL